MVAEGVGSAGIAVEQRREHAPGQCRREERGVPVQAAEHDALQCARGLAVLRQLLVVLGLGRLHAGSGAAIAPVRTGQHSACFAKFVGIENTLDVEQHGGGFA